MIHFLKVKQGKIICGEERLQRHKNYINIIIEVISIMNWSKKMGECPVQQRQKGKSDMNAQKGGKRAMTSLKKT